MSTPLNKRQSKAAAKDAVKLGKTNVDCQSEESEKEEEEEQIICTKSRVPNRSKKTRKVLGKRARSEDKEIEVPQQQLKRSNSAKLTDQVEEGALNLAQDEEKPQMMEEEVKP